MGVSLGKVCDKYISKRGKLKRIINYKENK